LTSGSFDEKVGKDKFAIIQFCIHAVPECEAITPEYERVYEHYANRDDILIAKIDSWHYNAIAQEYRIRSFPDIIFFKKGTHEGYERFEGERSAAKIIDWIDTRIKTETTPPTQENTDAPPPAQDNKKHVNNNQQNQQNQQQQSNEEVPDHPQFRQQNQPPTEDEEVRRGDGTVLNASDKPRNPKKKMWEENVESAKHEQAQAEQQGEGQGREKDEL